MKVGKDILASGKIYMHVALNWLLFKIGPAEKHWKLRWFRGYSARIESGSLG